MNQRKGFTLIELLVVLVIMGLLSALVLPKFPTIYEKFKSRAEQDDFFQGLSTLPLTAYTQQRSITLDQQSATSLLKVPSGWQLRIPRPIVYKPNGICMGGQIDYIAKGITTRVQLAPPLCSPAS